MIEAGSAVMFINPEQQVLGVATSDGWFDDESADWKNGASVEVCDQFARASLSIFPLQDFRSSRRGIASERLNHIYGQTQDLRDRNAASKQRAFELRKQKAAAAHAELKA